MTRPPGKHTKQLTEADRQRIKTLYDDAHMTPREICRVTGFTVAQIKYSVRQQTVTPGFKSRGRQKRIVECPSGSSLRNPSSSSPLVHTESSTSHVGSTSSSTEIASSENTSAKEAGCSGDASLVSLQTDLGDASLVSLQTDLSKEAVCSGDASLVSLQTEF